MIKKECLFDIAVGFGVVVLLLVTSCSPYQQQGAAVGGLTGAAAGAIFGHDRRDVARGAVAGAALGVGVAALQENQRRQSYARNDDGLRGNGPDDRDWRDESRLVAPRVDSPEYPTAQRTSNPDEVLSPYPPHHRINVEGFAPGQLARDPKTGKIFRIP